MNQDPNLPGGTSQSDIDKAGEGDLDECAVCGDIDTEELHDYQECPRCDAQFCLVCHQTISECPACDLDLKEK